MFLITIEGCHQEHYSRFCIKTVEHSRHLAPPGGVSGPARSSSPTSSCAPSVCATPAIDRSHPNVKVELANGEGKIFLSNTGHKPYDLNLEPEFRNVFFLFSVFYTDHVICSLPLGWLKTKKVITISELFSVQGQV